MFTCLQHHTNTYLFKGRGVVSLRKQNGMRVS
jgi:hypothetical protein